jgi:hypothetical protein
MHKACGVLLVAVVLSGCAAKPSKPPLPVSQIHPTPVCVGDDQCSEMWGRALRSLPAISRVRLMTATDSYLQTFPIDKVGYLNGTVFKQKVGDGKYSITASFDCRGKSWCADLSNRALDLFNVQVAGFSK